MQKFIYFAILTLSICILSITLPNIFFSQNTHSSDIIRTKAILPIENFALIDQNDVFHELYYYSDKKAIVLISQGNGCPIIRKSINYLNDLKNKYAGQNVTFLMINANSQDNRMSIAKEAQAFNFSMPILKDETQTISETLNIARTAEAFVINPANWSIVYHGSIHDQLGYESEKPHIKHHYLKNAIESLLNNRPLKTQKTSVNGCLINYLHERKNNTFSYTKDIAPILLNKCSTCHAPGGLAPWSMDDYETIRGWAPMIREVIRTKRMPPWHADQNYGHFKNDISLSPQEKRKIIHWVESLSTRGEGGDLLALEVKPQQNTWFKGTPDLIFRLKEKQHIQANGPDEFRFINANKKVENDIWVKAIDIKPSNTQVVHHSNLAIHWPATKDEQTDTPQTEVPDIKNNVAELYKLTGMTIKNGAIIAGYAPGSGPFILPENTGIFIPKGSTIVFRMHYITTGKEEEDLTELGLYLHENKPQKTLTVKLISNEKIHIKPGDQNYKRSGSITFEKPVTLISIQPHMHYRGKSMKFTLHYPGGENKTLLSVPHYKFHWQRQYQLNEHLKLPAGTRIEAEGYYDNSAQNLFNPNPSTDVYFGPMSQDEMFTGILTYIIDEEEPLVKD